MNRKLVIPIAVGVLGTILFLLLLWQSPGIGVQGVLQTSSAVQIPQALILAFNGLVFGMLTLGFTYILTHIGLDLTSFATPLAATLSTFLLGFAQSWIDWQPVSSDPYILMVLNILVVVIGGIPVFLFVRSRIAQ